MKLRKLALFLFSSMALNVYADDFQCRITQVKDVDKNILHYSDIINFEETK